ncbi:unnamed protein product, partial [Symbiodinium necroappetens]
ATSTAATSDTIAAATYPSTWSNPSGSVLTALNTDLWVAERPFIWNSIDVGGKMAVVRLPDGGLWVHSPVELDEELREALEQLGPVRHIVSPNFEHVKWAAQWKAAFPDATLWGTPGMKDKFPKIPFDIELPSSGSAPAEWGGALLLCFADCERTPLLGTPFFNEVLFYHVASETLMCSPAEHSHEPQALAHFSCLQQVREPATTSTCSDDLCRDVSLCRPIRLCCRNEV